MAESGEGERHRVRDRVTDRRREVHVGGGGRRRRGEGGRGGQVPLVFCTLPLKT